MANQALEVGAMRAYATMPTPFGSAQDVVRTLEASGFEVILNNATPTPAKSPLTQRCTS